MRGWWQLREGLFSARTCASWIEEAKKISSHAGAVGHGGALRQDAMRVSTVRWIHRTGSSNDKGQWTPVFTRLEELFHEANDNAFSFDVRHFPSLQFTEYHAEAQGHYSWHEDLAWVSPVEFHRKLSMVVQLSDPTTYEGGNLELSEDQPEQERLRRQGTVIVFPSFLRHRVTPVTSGVRYSVVAWMNGPKFR